MNSFIVIKQLTPFLLTSKKEAFTKFMNTDKNFLSGKRFPSLRQFYIKGSYVKEYAKRQENLIKNNVLAQKFERF